jgi:hypothetical protein
MSSNDTPQFVLQVSSLHWINIDSPEHDLCAHGSVRVQIGNEIVCDTTQPNSWCVSASALYLLRTLQQEHTKQHPVSEHLLPCCGHAMFDLEDQEDVVIIGCPAGINWEVRHMDGAVELRTENGSRVTLPLCMYTQIVLQYAKAIESFYVHSDQKVPFDEEDTRGFNKFWREWDRRIGAI